VLVRVCVWAGMGSRGFTVLAATLGRAALRESSSALHARSDLSSSPNRAFSACTCFSSTLMRCALSAALAGTPSAAKVGLSFIVSISDCVDARSSTSSCTQHAHVGGAARPTRLARSLAVGARCRSHARGLVCRAVRAVRYVVCIARCTQHAARGIAAWRSSRVGLFDSALCGTCGFTAGCGPTTGGALMI
jgi:hypothetical protein